MSAEGNVSRNLRTVAKALDNTLADIGGERMGFCLLVFPLERVGGAQYVSNCNRMDMVTQIRELVRQWDAGLGDMPLHEQH